MAATTITKLNIDIASKTDQAGAGLTRLEAALRRVNGTTNETRTGLSATAGGFALFAGKITLAYVALKRITEAVSGWIKESNAYQENLNLFTVAMGKYAAEAQKYAEQVSEAMGIDPAVWMRNQGVFQTLLTGFGNTAEAAYKMSTNLTQLGYDLSSFFNITVADAMQKLQSGIAGELEPLRRLGYDLSQARLQEIAFANGITQSVSSMNQAQKSQLRYIAIMTQVTTAQGDMARTLESPANQLRILQAASTQAARALGNIFIPALNAVLPYAIAFLNVVKTVANSLASLFGFKLTSVDYSGVNSATESMTDLENATSGAGGAAKALKNYLMGIDELNVIQPASASGGGGGGASLGDAFANLELPGYEFLEWIAAKVEEIQQKIENFFLFLRTSPELATLRQGFKDISSAISEVIDFVSKLMSSEDMQKILGGIVLLALEGIGTALSLIGDTLKMIVDLLEGDGQSALSHYGAYWARTWKAVRDYFWTVTYGIIAAFMGIEKNFLTMMAKLNDALGNKQGADEFRGMIDSLDERIANMNTAYELQLSINQKDLDKALEQMGLLHKPQTLVIDIKYSSTRKLPVGTFRPELAASGGVFNEGQMFIAREAGPEYVGSYGNRSVVANNDQIVDAVSRGVAQAVGSVLGNQKSGDDRPIVVKIGEREILTAVRSAEKNSGYRMSSSTVTR